MGARPQMGFVGPYRGPKAGAVDGFGAAAPGAPLTGITRAKVQASMQMAVYQLRTALAVAKARVATTPNSTIGLLVTALMPIAGLLGNWLNQSAPAEVKNSVTNALTTLGRVLDLREAAMQEVLDGRLDPVKWFKSVEELSKGIEPILAELKESSTAALLKKSMNDVQTDFETAWIEFKNTAPKVFAGLGITAVLIALGAGILLWPVLKQMLLSYVPARPSLPPSTPMAGLRRKRRIRSGRR